MDTKIVLRGGAGYYTGSVRVGPHAGTEVELERVTTTYGDTGWFAWVSRKQVTDYPRRTRAEALAVAVATINQEAR